VDAEYFRTLFAYNAWANECVLLKAAELSDAEYGAPVAGLSFGTLHATLAHIFAAEAVWLGRWQSRPVSGPVANAREMQPIIDTEVPTLAALRERWAIVGEGLTRFVSELKDDDPDRPLTYRLVDGSEYTQPLCEQMAHVVNHGTQFRSEAAVRLTQVGRSPGDLDLMVFLRQRQ
jgi:uncharacterized damage-inducible protein DinB